MACSDPNATLGTVEQSQQAIENGELDTEHLAVFRVLTRADGYNAVCSATLIAPNLMLTARHCVAEIPDTEVDCRTDRFGAKTSPDTLLFSNDTQPTLTSRWFRAKQVFVNDTDDAFCGNDVGLVMLDSNVPEDVATPAEVRLDPVVAANEPYIAVGYGGDMDGANAQYGVRHSRSDLVIECVGIGCGEQVTTQEFGGSDGGCPGDSGGPAFDASLHVLGTLSRGEKQCMAPVYSAVAQFSTLILSSAQQAAADGDYPLPVWAGGTPEPQTTKPADAGAPKPPPKKRAKVQAPKAESSCEFATQGTPSAVGVKAWAWLALAALAMRRRRGRQFSAT